MFIRLGAWILFPLAPCRFAPFAVTLSTTMSDATHAKSASFGCGIIRAEREITLLREYRTRLVKDMVTGQLDVRPAASHLPAELLDAIPRIPYRDAVGQSGLDGIVETVLGGRQFVPAGRSVWEIGTGAGPQAKATKDFTKRTKQMPQAERGNTSYVVVTPHSAMRTRAYLSNPPPSRPRSTSSPNRTQKTSPPTRRNRGVTPRPACLVCPLPP